MRRKVVLRTMRPKNAAVKDALDIGVAAAATTTGAHERKISLDRIGDHLLELLHQSANGRLAATEAHGHRTFAIVRWYEST